MSDAYERERQNNSRLDELSAKVSALRGVTIDIYDNARDQGVIDSTVRVAHLSGVRVVRGKGEGGRENGRERRGGRRGRRCTVRCCAVRCCAVRCCAVQRSHPIPLLSFPPSSSPSPLSFISPPRKESKPSTNLLSDRANPSPPSAPRSKAPPRASPAWPRVGTKSPF